MLALPNPGVVVVLPKDGAVIVLADENREVAGVVKVLVVDGIAFDWAPNANAGVGAELPNDGVDAAKLDCGKTLSGLLPNDAPKENEGLMLSLADRAVAVGAPNENTGALNDGSGSAAFGVGAVVVALPNVNLLGDSLLAGVGAALNLNRLCVVEVELVSAALVSFGAGVAPKANPKLGLLTLESLLGSDV